MGAPTIDLNSFATDRHVPEKRFSHFDGEWDEVRDLLRVMYERHRPGSRDGVILVPLPASRFRSGVVTVDERTALAASWTRRDEREDPYISVTAPGAVKSPAALVEAVLYRRDLLGDQATTNADWELISLNARTSLDAEPMTPLAMARNQLGRPGGSAASYSVEDLAAAILYWSKRVFVADDSVPLSGPLFPALTAGVARPAQGDLYILAWTNDPGVLPPAPQPEPIHPVTLARRRVGLERGRIPETPEAWCQAIYYWSSRPQIDPALSRPS